jgi:hypothetical protein
MRNTARPGLWASLLGLGALLLTPGAATAQLNQFEIKEPKVEQGEVEIEYGGDHHFQAPRRRFVEEDPAEFTFDGNEFNRERHSLGLGFGLTNWLNLQVGVEAEKARFEDVETIAQANAFDDLRITEIQFESTIVLIPVGSSGFGLAALIEHNVSLGGKEAHQLFLGTALQYENGPWSATANLNLVKNIGGGEEDGFNDERWDFQYAAQVKYELNSQLALAIEGFGGVERLWNSGHRSEESLLFGDFDRHLLGPVVYLTWKRPSTPGSASAKSDDDEAKGGGDDDDGISVTAGFGVLFGLNDDTADAALKWSLETEF